MNNKINNKNKYIFSDKDISKKVKCVLFDDLCIVRKISNTIVWVDCKYGKNIPLKKGLFEKVNKKKKWFNPYSQIK